MTISRFFFGHGAAAVVEANLSATQTVVVAQAASLSAPANLTATQPIAVAQAAALSAPASLSASQVITVGQAAVLSAPANLSATQTIAVAQAATLTAPAPDVNLSASQTIAVAQTANLVLVVTGEDTFSDETGSFPSGWALKWNTSNSTVTGQSAAPGTLQFVNTVSIQRRAVSMDAIGSVVDLEIMTSVNTLLNAGTGVATACVVTRGSGAAGAESGYAVILYKNPSSIRQLRLTRYNGGVNNILQDVGASNLWTDAAYYRVRFRVITNGANVDLKAKIWLDGQAEPGAWTSEFTDTSPILTAGWGGVMAQSVTTTNFDWVTYATNGGTAPEPTTSGVSNLSAVQPIAVTQQAALSAPANLSATQPIAVAQQAQVLLTRQLAASQTITVLQSAVLNTGIVTANLSAVQPITVAQSAQLSAPANLSAVQPITVAQSANLSVPANLNASQIITVGQTANLILTAQRNLSASQAITVAQTANLVLTQRLSAAQVITVGQTARLSAPANISASQPIVVLQQANILSINRTLSANQPIVIDQQARLKLTALDGPPIYLTGDLDMADELTGSLDLPLLVGSFGDEQLTGSF